MQQIFENFLDVGVATTVIALAVILIVGLVKLIPAVKNMNKNWRKALLQVLSIILGGAISVAYCMVVEKMGWHMDLLYFASIVVAEINVIYPLYENLGIRELLKKVANGIYSALFKKKITTSETTTTSTEGDFNPEWLE